MRPVRNVPSRYGDYWTEVLGTLVVGLALLLGWMLGRPSWESVPLRELRVRGREKASPAVQRRRAATQTQKPVEEYVEKSTEQTANGSIAKRSVPAKSTAGGDPAPGALVIYQNGKEIFRMQPVAAEPDQGGLQGAASRQQALTLGQVTSPARDTASTAEPKFLRVEADVAASRLTRRIEPQYPSQAQEPQIQGPVVLQALISKEGDIRTYRVVLRLYLAVQKNGYGEQQWQTLQLHFKWATFVAGLSRSGSDRISALLAVSPSLLAVI